MLFFLSSLYYFIRYIFIILLLVISLLRYKIFYSTGNKVFCFICTRTIKEEEKLFSSFIFSLHLSKKSFSVLSWILWILFAPIIKINSLNAATEDWGWSNSNSFIKILFELCVMRADCRSVFLTRHFHWWY